MSTSDSSNTTNSSKPELDEKLIAKAEKKTRVLEDDIHQHDAKTDDSAEGEEFDSESGEATLKCEKPGCDKMFKSKYTLRRHMATHVDVKKFVCDYCGKRFALKQYLKEHLYIHTGESPYTCPYEGCRRSFKQAGKLSMHKKLHELDDTKSQLQKAQDEILKLRQSLQSAQTTISMINHSTSAANPSSTSLVNPCSTHCCHGHQHSHHHHHGVSSGIPTNTPYDAAMARMNGNSSSVTSFSPHGQQQQQQQTFHLQQRQQQQQMQASMLRQQSVQMHQQGAQSGTGFASTMNGGGMGAFRGAATTSALSAALMNNHQEIMGGVSATSASQHQQYHQQQIQAQYSHSGVAATMHSGVNQGISLPQSCATSSTHSAAGSLSNFGGMFARQ